MALRGIGFLVVLFFFFNDTATTEIYTLSLHDALPISGAAAGRLGHWRGRGPGGALVRPGTGPVREHQRQRQPAAGRRLPRQDGPGAGPPPGPAAAPDRAGNPGKDRKSVV